MEMCSLPLRPTDSAVDDRVAAAVRRLAELLLNTPEYQAFVVATQAVSRDEQVSQLVKEIRACRATFNGGDAGKLQSKLQELPVMAEYERSMQALRTLFTGVDQAISAAAGLGFVANVRPDRHG